MSSVNVYRILQTFAELRQKKIKKIGGHSVNFYRSLTKKATCFRVNCVKIRGIVKKHILVL